MITKNSQKTYGVMSDKAPKGKFKVGTKKKKSPAKAAKYGFMPKANPRGILKDNF